MSGWQGRMRACEASPRAPFAIEALSGTTLDERYRLGRVLGTGGMGAVFEATDLRLGRTVAIKLIRPAFAGHEEYVQRFLREAQMVSRVRHGNVVVLLDYGEADGGLVYAVMEFLVGQDLEKRLRERPEGRLPWTRALGLLVQIASGLRAAHAQGVIHRDIKPANCLVTEQDGESVVKIVDFGIAKLDDATQTRSLTGADELLGTPSYIAPELLRTQGSASPRSDVYSLGVVAYRMLAGRLPFTGATAFEVMRRACTDPVPSIREQLPEVPPPVEALVRQMLAKKPEDRPANMLVVRQRLQALGREPLRAWAEDPRVSSPSRLDDEGSAIACTGSPTRGTGRPAEFLADPADDVPTVASKVLGKGLGWPPGETLPVLGESTLPKVGSTLAPEPRPGRAPWLVVSGLLSLLGGLALSTMLVGTRDDPPGVGGEFVAVGEPEAISEPEIEVVVAEPEATTEPVIDVEQGQRIGALRRVEDDRSAGSAPPASLSARVEDDRSAGSAPSASPPARVEDDRSAGSAPPASPLATAQARPPQEHEQPAAFEPEPTRIAAPRRPAGPPSDAALRKRLGRKIKARCADPMRGRRVSVSFLVRTRGEVGLLTATPKDAAGQCAKRQVQGTRFRARGADTPIQIVVE